MEIKSGYCPICDKEIIVCSSDIMCNCPDCGHHIVLHNENKINNKSLDGKNMGASLRESEIIEKLLRVATELDARERSSNSVMLEYHGTGWEELCDIGIDLLKQLKV